MSQRDQPPPQPIRPRTLRQTLQFQEIFRVQNRSEAEDCPRTLRNVVVRQWLPLSDRVQDLDWFVLSDLDPRVASVEVRDWFSEEQRNRYLNWLIPEIAPGECAQIGYVAGMTLRTNAGGSFRARSRSAPDLDGASPLLSLSNLCQFMPVSYDPGDGIEGLEPVDAEAGGEFETWAGGGDDSVLSLSERYLQPTVWLKLDDWLQDFFAPANPAPWYAQTRARRLAALVMAIVNAQEYGNTGGEDSLGGFFRWTLPGADDWPALLRQGMLVLTHIESKLGNGAVDPPFSVQGLRNAGSGYLAENIEQPIACTCSERTFQMLWMLRLAGIPCRELGGQRLSEGAKRTLGLPVGKRIGHRIVEAWDA
jgi:hypothetical protein